MHTFNPLHHMEYVKKMLCAGCVDKSANVPVPTRRQHRAAPCMLPWEEHYPKLSLPSHSVVRPTHRLRSRKRWPSWQEAEQKPWANPCHHPPLQGEVAWHGSSSHGVSLLRSLHQTHHHGGPCTSSKTTRTIFLSSFEGLALFEVFTTLEDPFVSAVGTFGKIRLPLTRIKSRDGICPSLGMIHTRLTHTALYYSTIVGGRLACAQSFTMSEAIVIFKNNWFT